MARRWRVAAVVAVSAFGLGAATAMVVAPAPAPSWADPATPVQGEVQVTAQEYTGQGPVSATPAIGAQTTLVWPTGGVLRVSQCAAGEPIASGTAPFVVDDRPVLALHTQTPLWRDLAQGMRGDDVLAVQRELNRLGASVPEDGRFRAATAAAVRDLWSRVGGNPRQATIPLAQVIWLPEPSVTVAECAAGAGARVADGDDAVQVGGRLESLTLALPDGSGDGQWVATIPGTEHVSPVPADGVLTDPGFLAAVEQTGAFQQVVSDGQRTVSVTTRLAHPQAVVAVPASALYDVVGTAGCVVGDGVPTAVQIVASQFGQTHVAADPLPTRVQVAPVAPAPCR